MSLIKTIDDFQKDVIERSNDQLIIIDFWAPWCMPCKMLEPVISKLATQYEGKVTFYKLNIDEQYEIATQQRVNAIPNLTAFHKGSAVDNKIGSQSVANLTIWIDKLLENDSSAKE